MKVGIVDRAFGEAGETSAFAAAERFGFEGLRVQITRDQLRSRDRARLERLDRARSSTGLAIAGLELADQCEAGGILSSDPDLVRAGEKEIVAALDWAEALDTRILILPFWGRSKIDTSVRFDRAATVLGPLCMAAAARRIKLAVEATLTVDQYVELADRIDSDALTWCFDPANEVWLGHDPGADIRALGRRITLVDLKDIEESAGDRVFGRGRTDFADVAAALNETGYDGWLIVEQSNLDHLPQVVQAVRAVFALR